MDSRGPFHQIRQSSRRAREPLPPVRMCGVFAPAVRIGQVSVFQPVEHLRSLRTPCELVYERPENFVGEATYDWT
jgi:hypothetical protein